MKATLAVAAMRLTNRKATAASQNQAPDGRVDQPVEPVCRPVDGPSVQHAIGPQQDVALKPDKECEREEQP